VIQSIHGNQSRSIGRAPQRAKKGLTIATYAKNSGLQIWCFLGRPEELLHQIPLELYMAKFINDHLGLDTLLKSDWNLFEAEAEFGSDWLTI
jgi:hypothetical protein